MKTAKNLNWLLATVVGCLILSIMTCFAAMLTDVFPRALAEAEHTHVSTGDNVATLTHKAVCDECGEPYVTMIDKIELTSTFDFANVKYGDVGLQNNSEYGISIKNLPVCKLLNVRKRYSINGGNSRVPYFWSTGTYFFAIKIEIMSAYRDIYDFAPDAVAEVNGVTWTVQKDSTANITCVSPAFTVEKTETELKFHNFNGWIPSRTVGESFSSNIIQSYVFGGTKPYTFSKVSGPDWVEVAEDGMLTGTPTEPAPEAKVGIRVTDATGAYKEINFMVGKVSEAISVDKFPVLDKLEIATDFTAPIYGEKGMTKLRYREKKYKSGVNLYFDSIKYLSGGKEEYSKDSATYLDANAVFGEGKYTVVLHFYNLIYSSEYYKFSETTEVLIDGEPWQVLKVETTEKRSNIVICKEFEVLPYEHTEHKHVSTGDNVATATRKAVCDVCGVSYKTEIGYVKLTADVDIEGINYGDKVLRYARDYGLKIVNYPDGIMWISNYFLNPEEATYRTYYDEGVYSHSMFLSIEESCYDIFCFANDVEVEVNGKGWNHYSKAMISCGVESPSFTIVKDESVFKFYDEKAAISTTKKGEAIEPVDLNGCVLGGKSPYTFTKVSGPTWLSVAENGTVSGTPDRGGENEALVIRVTDANGKTLEASVSVGVTYFVADVATLPELKKITITSDFTAPVFGSECKFDYTFTVDGRSDIKFWPMGNSESEILLWVKGTFEDGKALTTGDRFGIGTYTAIIWPYRYHVGENDFKFTENLEAYVNGELWNIDSHYIYVGSEGTQAYLYKEFKVTDDGHVHEYGDLIQEVLSTCSTKGMKAHYECAACHTLFDENKTEKSAADLEIAIDPTAHKFGEWQSEKKANCATLGVKAHKTCEYCKNHFDESENKIDVLSIAKNDDHDLAEGWNKSTEEHYKLCKRTGCKDDNKVDCAAHTPDRLEATEDDPVVCTVCGYVITPVKGHVHSVKFVRGYAETCTENGQKDYYECSDGEHPCHKRFKDSAATQEIPDDSWIVLFAHHDFTSWIDEVPATVEADGVKAHKDCSACHKHFDADGNELTDADLKIEKLPKPELPTVKEEEKEGLSGGAIAGIVIGSVAVAGLGGFAIFWFVVKKKKWADLIAVFKKMFAKK